MMKKSKLLKYSIKITLFACYQDYIDRINNFNLVGSDYGINFIQLSFEEYVKLVKKNLKLSIPKNNVNDDLGDFINDNN